MNTDTLRVTALGHSRDHLEAARMAEFVFVPKTDAARALVAHLTAITLDHEAKVKPRNRKRQAEAQRSFTGAVSAFAADLIHHARFQEAEGFFYRSYDKEALGQTFVSVRCFEQLLQFWAEMGLMEVTRFFRVRETWEGEDTGTGFGRARRFRATAELLSLAEGFGITPDTLKDHFQKETGRLSPVTVRSEVANRHGTGVTSANMRFAGPKYEAEVQRVKEINAILGQGGFDLAETPRVYRLFSRGNFHNFDFNMGGRLYCCSEDDWQQRPKEDRALITCRGEPTVELDVGSSHLFILYALHDLELDTDDDPYFLPGVEREVVKGLFAAMTGKGSRLTRFPKKLSEDYMKPTGRKISTVYKLGKVLDALIAKHPILNKLKKGSMDWARLQYEESECFMECLTRLGHDHGVAALPVFDSLIVAKQHRDVALTCLVEAYGNRFGCLPEVRCK